MTKVETILINNTELDVAIKQNSKDLMEAYKLKAISYDEIRQLHKQAVNDEEYRVAISIRDVLNKILREDITDNEL